MGSETFQVSGGFAFPPPLSGWQVSHLAVPEDSVTSVNGKKGKITLAL